MSGETEDVNEEACYLPTPPSSSVNLNKQGTGGRVIRDSSARPNGVLSASQMPSRSASQDRRDYEKDEREVFSKLEKPRVRYDVEVITKLIVYTGKGHCRYGKVKADIDHRHCMACCRGQSDPFRSFRSWNAQGELLRQGQARFQKSRLLYQRNIGRYDCYKLKARKRTSFETHTSLTLSVHAAMMTSRSATAIKRRPYTITAKMRLFIATCLPTIASNEGHVSVIDPLWIRTCQCTQWKIKCFLNSMLRELDRTVRGSWKSSGCRNRKPHKGEMGRVSIYATYYVHLPICSNSFVTRG